MVIHRFYTSFKKRNEIKKYSLRGEYSAASVRYSSQYKANSKGGTSSSLVSGVDGFSPCSEW